MAPPPPWDDQIFDFGWNPYGPSISQCSPILITTNDRKKASVPSMKPYVVGLLAGGYVPQQANTTVQPDGSYLWIPDIPLGIGPHVLYMADAQGYTGGTSLAFQMTPDSTCTTRAWTPNQLAFNVTGEPKQCGTMTITMNSGTAPYKLQAIVGERPPKTTHWTSTQMTHIVDLSISEKFFLFMTDSEGKTAVSGIYTVGAGLTDSCYNLATTLTVGIENLSTYSTSLPSVQPSVQPSVNTSASASSPALIPSLPSKQDPISTYAIVGAVVGSIAFVALLVGIGILLCLKRRHKPKGKGRRIDLGADRQTQEFRPSPSIFSPFEYQEFPDYGQRPSPDARIAGSPGSPGSPSSQALLFAWDSASPPGNSQTYSMSSRDTTTSGTHWGDKASVRNSAVVSMPYASLTPSMPPIREKRQLTMTNASEREASSPIAVGSGAPSPPPYSARQ